MQIKLLVLLSLLLNFILFNITRLKKRSKEYIEDITWPRGDTNFILEC